MPCNKDVGILILSCDKYSDLWDGLVNSFKIYWPSCPYKRYLVSNEIIYPSDWICNVRTGRDEGWAQSFKSALDQIEEPVVFVWLEDAYITSKPDEDEFSGAASLILNGKYEHIHFRPLPKPDTEDKENPIVGVYDAGRPYSVNLVGFWNKEVLISMLLPGESPWNFEIYGSYRFQYVGRAGCLNKKLWNYIHLVEKGKWLPSAKNELKFIGLELDLSTREELDGVCKFSSIFKALVFDLMSNLNWKIRIELVGFFRRLLGTY